MNRIPRLFLFAILAAVGVAQNEVSTPAPKTTDQAFKNIQTLKGLPADQLVPTMQFITASLGVECEYCHVEGAFDKDDKKPKQTARKMMEMMFAIDKGSFEGRRAVSEQFDDDQNQFPLEPFFTLDAIASRSLGKGIEVFGAFENLTSERYDIGRTPIRTIGPPLLARVGLRLNLGGR